MLFRDRLYAGQVLARRLSTYANRLDVLVLALPRGGVPVACEVARALYAPVDVLVVDDLAFPGQVELSMGASASGSARVLSFDAVDYWRIPTSVVDALASRSNEEVDRRTRLYRAGRRPPVVRGRTVILVSDGVASASAVLAAVADLRDQSPARIVVAAPVGSQTAYDELESVVDECVFVSKPERIYDVGHYFSDAAGVSDKQVCELLTLADRAWNAPLQFV
jgi:putative phosphoribosyl transferase